MATFEPTTVVGGLDHTHLLAYNSKANRYECVGAKCTAKLPNPIPSDIKYVRRGDYVVVLDHA